MTVRLARLSIKPMEMNAVVEFQKRRAKVWRRVRYPVSFMLAGILVLIFHCKGGLPETASQFWPCSISFLIVFGVIGYIAFTWKLLYRCPSCEAPVQNSYARGGDVPFNPNVCPNCGIRIR